MEPDRGRSGHQSWPGEDVIRTPDQRLRVFVSSTLGELADERQAVSRAITALRLTPVMFELGARPHPPQELYRAYLAQSDVFVGLYWQRYGWVGPGMDISGLEDEFQLSQGFPRLLYVKDPAPDREPRLAEMLSRIEAEGRDAYRHFRTARELGRLVRDDLATLLSEQFAAAQHPAAAKPPPPSGPRGPRPLPGDLTSLVGRERDIDEVSGLVGRPDVRLVTLTGLGGIGKTRLAVAVAERLADRFEGRTAFVPLATVTEPGLVLTAVARAVGVELGGSGSPLETLVEYFADDRWLLILDNLEQVVDAAGDIDGLLARCPGVVVLATSRTVLGLRAEHEYPVSPLSLPADLASTPVAELAATPAIALFVDRAQAARPGFTLTEGNAAAVAEICRRLDGLPLAIELAAARTRLLDPNALLRRLATSLDALGTGAVDLPERQRTLRATVEWSVDLLDDAERSLLEAAAVFVDGWTTEAAAEVAGLDEDEALDRFDSLARHSLLHVEPAEDGPRLRMLETIRAFMAERLAARPDAAEIRRRHAGCYRAMAEQADRPLRGAGQRVWCQRLDDDQGNLAAAVRWHLDNDTGPLPHLLRVLWLYWFLRDHLGEASPWVDQLLPAADSFDLEARTELAWTATATGLEVGDDQMTLAAAERLTSLVEDVADPYLRAVSRLVIAWSSAIGSDLDSYLHGAVVSLERLRAQDEPFWTALAAYTAGLVELTTGRYDDARRHLTEMRELAESLDNAWLAAVSRVYLGTLAVAEGRPEEARAPMEEGLELSLAAHSTRSVTLCLAAFARLAFVEGDLRRAALLTGAADGLRARVGLRPWPLLRQGEATLVGQVREALGDGFDEPYSTGATLSQQQAVAAVRDRPAAVPERG